MHEVAHRVIEAVAEPAFVVGRQRQLVGRAGHLGAQHERVLGIHDGPLGQSVGQFLRVRGIPLVELIVAGDEDCSRPPARAPGAPGLLPHRRQRPGETVEDDRVQAADVDAEFQCVRRRDPEQPSARQVLFELAPLLGQVAGAVCGHQGLTTSIAAPVAAAVVGVEVGEPSARVRGDELRAPTTARERERLMSGADESRQEIGGFDVPRPARARMHVEQRSLPTGEHAFGTRRAVVVDRVDRPSAQRRCELARVADRCAREAERRRGAVVLAQSLQAPENVGDLATEDAAQGVELVDHDVAQPHEERRPLLVRREDADVQHFRICQQDVGVLAGPGAVVAVRVAVVGDGAQSGDEPGPQRSKLILRECLGGVDQQCGVAPAGDHRFDDRDLVAERLARRSAGCDDHARSGAQAIDGRRLMCVQLEDVPRPQARDDLVVHGLDGLGVVGVARRDHLAVHETAGQLGVRGERVERGARVHRLHGTYRVGQVGAAARALRWGRVDFSATGAWRRPRSLRRARRPRRQLGGSRHPRSGSSHCVRRRDRCGARCERAGRRR